MSDAGVSVDFFCTSIKTLSKIHGPKKGGNPLEGMRAALAEAEMFYKSLPDHVKEVKPKRRSKRA